MAVIPGGLPTLKPIPLLLAPPEDPGGHGYPVNPGFDYGSTNFGFGDFVPSGNGGGYNSGGFTNGPPTGGSPPGLNTGWDIGIGVGGVTVGPGGSGGGPGAGVSVNTATGALSWFTAIPWGRIIAFLLGLLLVAGGLYLIKPVQQVVKNAVKVP